MPAISYSTAPFPSHLFLLLPRPQSFFRYNSFKNPVGASDVVYAASSLLEMFASEESPEAGQGEALQGGAGGAGGSSGVLRQVAFNEAYDCLGMQSEALLKKGVLAALALQRVSLDQPQLASRRS